MELHKLFGSRLEIMMFPSDEFGGQELAEGKVGDFCESKGLPANKDHVHLMAKGNVNGPMAHPVWQLAKTKFPGEVQWNFDGIFLFDKAGHVVSRHSIRAPPTTEQISKLVEAASL